MTSTGAVAGVAFLAYLEHPLAPRPRPGQIVVLDRLGGAPQTGGAGGDRSAGVRVGAVAWVRPGLQPQRVGFQQDRGVRESCGGEDEGERWTLRSRLRWGRCRWGMWWVGLSMPESRITHCENRCSAWGTTARSITLGTTSRVFIGSTFAIQCELSLSRCQYRAHEAQEASLPPRILSKSLLWIVRWSLPKESGSRSSNHLRSLPNTAEASA